MNWPDKLRDLFAAASELPAGERERLLERECAGQPELRRTLDDLLRADEGAQGNTLWERPALQSEARRTAASQSLPGILGSEQLGPYRILKRIGTGGMGVVWLAEGDYDGVRKQVAIKAIPYVFDDDMVRRFQQERRILAGLEHPNIARMLDAGTDGVPYLVMEYVDGLPLGRYADERQLSVNARLHLFRQICEAVAYAHRKLIVHRDLKPGNILVTAEGVPKLLDFGIARLLDESLAEATVTAMMTPRYASPEQLAGRPITTASDIYSLGVILYELVTGRRPGGAGVPVHRPTHGGSTADARPLEGLDHPSRRLKGDLHNVVSMALREEPERRYASAADFGEDIRRVIERYPVRARRDTVGYRLRRFVSRRPVEVAVTIALAAVVLMAGIVALGQYRSANRRFQDVREVANSFLFEVYDAIADQPGTTRARAIIAARAQQYLDGLARDRSSDVPLRRELATAYRKLGDIQGAPFVANLGDSAGALRNYKKASGILEAMSASGSQDAALYLALGDIYEKEARIAGRDGSLSFAEEIAGAEKSVRAREKAVALNRSSIEARRAFVNGSLFLALCHGEAGEARNDIAELRTAEALNGRALSAARQLNAENPGDESLRLLLVKAYEYAAYAESSLAGAINDRQYRVRALRLFEEEVDAAKPLYTRDPDRYRRTRADTLLDLARGWLAIGAGRQAEEPAREGLQVFQQIAAGDPNDYEAARDVFVAHWILAKALAAQNRDATEEFEATLEGYERVHPRNLEDRAVTVVAESRDWLAAHALAAGHRAEAIGQYRRSIEFLSGSSLAPDVAWLALDQEALGDVLTPSDRAQAAECYRQALALWEKLGDAGSLPSRYAGKAAEVRQKVQHF